MTHIINLLLFLKELIFGREASSKFNRKQSFRSTLVIAVLAVSLLGNWVLLKSLYTSTSKSISQKEQIYELRGQVEQCKGYKQEIEALDRIIKRLTGSDSDFPDQMIATPTPVPKTPPAPPNPASKVIPLVIPRAEEPTE